MTARVRARLLPLGALLLAHLSAPAGMIELVSRAAKFGDTGGGSSGSASVSSDGRYVAFSSTAPNLVSGVSDGNGTSDVFLYDRLAGSTTLVSASGSNPGHAANGPSSVPVVSADGRFVVYQSTATDLVPGQLDSNLKTDVFLYDRASGATVLVSHSAVSVVLSGNGVSGNGVLSSDGRWVAFQSGATDLVAGQAGTAGRSNVFLWDRTTGAVSLLSHAAASAATGGSSDSIFPNISQDGSVVAFFSFASDLVAGQVATPGGSVYAWDRSSGLVALVSHTPGAPLTAADGTTDHQSLSADGRFVVLRSNASNLVPGQSTAPGYGHVFLHDRALDTTVLVSRKTGSSATGSNGSSPFCQGSADGRFVVFTSLSTDLVPGFLDANGPSSSDVFLFDRLADSVSLVSRSAGSPTTGGNGESSFSDISFDGRLVALRSAGTDLVAGQGGPAGNDNAFIFDSLSGTSRLASHASGAPLTAASSSSYPLRFSGNGAFLVLSTLATDLQAGLVDDNGTSDLYLFDLISASNSLITLRAPDLPNLAGNDFSTYPFTYMNGMSDDGRFIVYSSQATNLMAGQVDTNDATDVFLSDRRSRTSMLVSHAAASLTTAGNAVSYSASVSADGRWVAFASRASDLVSGVTDVTGNADVFLFDRLAGTNIFVSKGAGTTGPANGDSIYPVVSRDGRFIVFSSAATDLVPGQVDANSSSDVFLYDRVADAVTLVSHVAGSALTSGNGFSDSALVSRDGAFVAFVSGATNLSSGLPGAFLFERATGVLTLVGPADRSAYPPVVLSEDGNWVAYATNAANVIPGQIQPYAVTSVFLHDRVGGGTRLVSHKAGSTVTTPNGSSSMPSLSADGRFVAFASLATNLLAGVPDFNNLQDVFLYDRLDGSVNLVSAASEGASTAWNGSSGGHVVSADGSHVAFTSVATNIVPGQDTSATVNVFLFSRATGASVLASGSMSSPTKGGNSDTYPPVSPIVSSASGSVIAFESYASDLVPGDFNRASDMFAFALGYEAPPSAFYAILPCRVADTRGPAGPWGAPPLAPNASRTLVLAGRCGIPLDAVAVSANVTVVAPAADGAFTFYPAGFAPGGTSTVNFRAGQTRANNAILGLGAGGATAVDVASPGPAHLVLDVNGYFK